MRRAAPCAGRVGEVRAPVRPEVSCVAGISGEAGAFEELGISGAAGVFEAAGMAGAVMLCGRGPAWYESCEWGSQQQPNTHSA